MQNEFSRTFSEQGNFKSRGRSGTIFWLTAGGAKASTEAFHFSWEMCSPLPCLKIRALEQIQIGKVPFHKYWKNNPLLRQTWMEIAVFMDVIWNLPPYNLSCLSFLCFTSVLIVRFGYKCGQVSFFHICYCCKGNCEADVVMEIRSPHSKLGPWRPPTYKDSNREKSCSQEVNPADVLLP